MRFWWKRQTSQGNTGEGTLLGRLRRDSRGNTLAMLAASMVPIAAMVGSGLDMSRAYMAQAKMQNACDAAALAARREMVGNTWSDSAEAEGNRFFEFNFPEGTMSAENLEYDVSQSADDDGTVEVTASADIPTTVMSMFGKQSIPISVDCDANQDYGNNDIMVVLDVTGSMNNNASGGGGSKIGRLRTAAMGLYRALADANDTRTRFGIMPYSGTVNVGASLRNQDIRVVSYYQKQGTYVCTSYRSNGTCRSGYYPYSLQPENISTTRWWTGNQDTSLTAWRTNGSACVEERSSIGNTGQPVSITNSVSRSDIDSTASSQSDTALQWGRYDDVEEEGETQVACPSPATRLQTYANETAFQTAINTATANVTGGTYHDVGMVWAMRFLSGTGMFASDNPDEYNSVPVSRHIVFLTDGETDTDTNTTYYSNVGQLERETRMTGSGTSNERHVARFQSACTLAKSMGITVWVIALDVGHTDDIEPCATDAEHFFTSDGSDLESVFEQIGQGIGRLRLTR